MNYSSSLSVVPDLSYSSRCKILLMDSHTLNYFCFQHKPLAVNAHIECTNHVASHLNFIFGTQRLGVENGNL